MKNLNRIIWIVIAGWALGAGASFSDTSGADRLLNHAFDVDAASATACLDGVVFNGQATGADSLNILMTSQVFDQGGTTLLATGDTNTFTSVNEIFTFTVLYPSTTFNVGDAIGLSVTDNPPTLFGSQGDFANSARVANCSLASVPALPAWGFGLLALMLAAAGAVMTTRGRKVTRA